MAATPWPEDGPDWRRLHAYEVSGYPRPMIDTRYLRRANGTATALDLESIARDEVTIPLVFAKAIADATPLVMRGDTGDVSYVVGGARVLDDDDVQFVLDGLGVESLEELHRLVDAGREYEALTGNAPVETATDADEDGPQ